MQPRRQNRSCLPDESKGFRWHQAARRCRLYWLSRLVPHAENMKIARFPAVHRHGQAAQPAESAYFAGDLTALALTPLPALRYDLGRVECPNQY